MRNIEKTLGVNTDMLSVTDQGRAGLEISEDIRLVPYSLSALTLIL